MRKDIFFNKRPVSQSIDYRPIWKIGQLMLVIRDGSSVSGCSLLKIHLFSWVFQSYKNKQKLRKWINSDFNIEMSIWTLSPHVNMAISFALGEKLVIEQKGKYKLTEKGNKYLEKIDTLEDSYIDERKTLDRYGSVISDSKIDKLAKDWK